MIEIVTKIDCAKTEKALLAVCKITDNSLEELIKKWLDINQTLIDIAEAAKSDEKVMTIIKLSGTKCLDDLLAILD